MMKNWLLVFVMIGALLNGGAVEGQSCAEPILTVGDTGRILGGTPNRVRSEPNPDADILLEIPGGGTFTALELGPCTGDIRWVRVQYGGQIGWTAEGIGVEAFVERVQASNGWGNVGVTRGAALNADQTLLAAGNRLYNPDDLLAPPRVLTNRNEDASSVFSPTDPNLLFRYYQDHEFALVDVRDNRTLWSASMEPPSGIGGGVYMQEAYFTPDGGRVVFSATEPDYSWQVLDIASQTTQHVRRGYYGEAVAITPDGDALVRSITLISPEPNNRPSLFFTDLNTLEGTGPSGVAQRLANVRDVRYLPSGFLLAFDTNGFIDLYNPDLSYGRNLFDTAAGVELIGWDVGPYVTILRYFPSNPDEQGGILELRLMDVNTLETLGVVTMPTGVNLGGFGNTVVMHPDGRVGMLINGYFRWVPADAIIAGTLTEIPLPEAIAAG